MTVSRLSDERALGLAQTWATPFYAVHSGQVVGEFARLQSALDREGIRSALGYSVKTNYLPALIRAVYEAGHLVEVVSRHELAYVQALDIPAEALIFNGPGKSAADIVEAVRQGIRVNVDSMAEIRQVSALLGPGTGIPLGLRVAVDLPSGQRSRFGVDLEDSLEELQSLLADDTIRITGLHLHYSSDRTAESYAERVRLLSAVARRLQIVPDYLDIGGGLASDLPDSVRAQLRYPLSSFDDYGAAIGSAMRAEWGTGDLPLLVLEPGTAMLSGALSYVTSVVSTRPRDEIAVVDGTMFEVNPLRSSVLPPTRLVPRHAAVAGRTALFGGTCMEIDTLGSVDGAAAVGDLVVVDNVGAYTLVLAPEFILPKARVVDAESGDLLRDAQPLGHLGGTP